MRKTVTMDTHATDLVQLYRRAETYLDRGAPLAALETLAPIEQDIAQTASGQLLLARAYYHSAQLTRAERAFSRLVERDPSDDYARFALGRTLHRQNRLAEAAAHYRIAVALSDRAEYRDWLDEVTFLLADAAGGSRRAVA